MYKFADERRCIICSAAHNMPDKSHHCIVLRVDRTFFFGAYDNSIGPGALPISPSGLVWSGLQVWREIGGWNTPLISSVIVSCIWTTRFHSVCVVQGWRHASGRALRQLSTRPRQTLSRFAPWNKSVMRHPPSHVTLLFTSKHPSHWSVELGTPVSTAV